MERPSGFRASHKVLFIPHRFGEEKWEDYILDTQTYIYDGAQSQVEAIDRASRKASEQSREQAQLLQDFIAHAAGAWERVSGQLDVLTEELVFGFSCLEHWTKYNAARLDQILGQLDSIAEMVKNPLATQENELVRRGEHLLARGLYKEAYDELKAAEAKRSVNPMLHLHLAQLHYRFKEEGVPFDLVAAEKHVNLAIRYTTSLRGDLGERGYVIADLVFSTAASLARIRGSDLCKLAGQDAGNAELCRADEFLLRIDQPSPSSQFLHAEMLALLGRPEESYDKVRELADFTRSWIPRALSAPDLSSIADRIGKLRKDLKTKPGIHSQGAYTAMSASREFALKSEAIAREFNLPSRELTEEINEIEHNFEFGAIDAACAVSDIERACESLKFKVKSWIEALEAESNRIDQEIKTIEEKIKTERDGITECWHYSAIAIAAEGGLFLAAKICEGLSHDAPNHYGFGMIVGIFEGIFGSLGVLIFGLVFWAGIAIVPIIVLYSVVIAIKRNAAIVKLEGQIRTFKTRKLSA